MTFSRAKWANSKAEIAERLERQEAGGSYSEAIIVLCATLSAMAAEVWPGERIDRKRFVQLLIQFSNQPPFAATISVPLLVSFLRIDGRNVEVAALKSALLNFGGSRVVTGKHVDRGEDDVLTICPSIQRSQLRKHSYANILYERVRSPFIHEYRPGAKTSSWPMTDYADAKVSYVNWIDDPDRHIFIHTKWLVSLVREVGIRADLEQKSFPRAMPSSWWVDG